jgi:hypothetical protein
MAKGPRPGTGLAVIHVMVDVLRRTVIAVGLTGLAAAPHGTVPVSVAFRNLHLHVAEGVVMEVRHIEGAMLSTQAGRPPVFDDQNSFKLRIDSGEIAMTPASLSRLLNDHVFAYEGSPLKNLELSIENGHLKQKGTLRKGVPVPFTIVADLSATQDGRIKVHPIDVKAAGIPSEGLMKLFGVELDDLIKSNRSHGVQIADNDLLLDPSRLLPSPSLAGKLTAVHLESDRIVERFGSGARGKLSADADRRARNYMYYRGGTLRFGKLTMSDTDMQLIDADPSDPFDFSPPEYVKQLVAGYSKNTPSGGLRVFMPDFNQAAGANLRPTTARVLH